MIEERETSKLKGSLIRARLDCLLFFHVQEFGGFYRVIDERGKPQMLSRLTFSEKFNFPSSSRVQWANRRVRESAPSAAQEYRLCTRRWHEARRRFCATRDKLTWNRFLVERNYKTTIAIARRGGIDHYKRYICPYLASELKPRMEERRRARREMKASDARITELRVVIYAAMGVPADLRE